MIKKIIVKILVMDYLLKCSIRLWLFGPYGVSDILKTAPYPAIQPILKKFGANIGNNCVIDTGLVIHRPDNCRPFKKLTIADNCYIGHNVLFDLTSEVTIEQDVGIGASCQFWTHVGDYKESLMDKSNDYHERIAPITVQQRTIVYSGVIISPGINIGEFSRVGAGSLVIDDIPPHVFAAGSPAHNIREL